MQRTVAVVGLLCVAGCTGRTTGSNSSSTGGGTSSSSSGSGSSSPASSSSSSSSSGASASSGGARLGHYFPDGAWMYQDISAAPLHAQSAQITQWLADNGGWGLGRMQIDTSILVLQAEANTPLVTRNGTTTTFYSPDCDDVPMPIPAGGAVEGENGYVCTGGGDCHLLVVDRRVNRLFEAYTASYDGSVFDAACIAAWDMTRVYGPAGRGEQCTSSDAAGFPITPLLFTAQEVAAGNIDHAIRFILPNARMRQGFYVHPATHAGGPSATSAVAPTYGTRWRLKASFDLSRLHNEAARVVARAMQRYGMALSDGGNVALTAASDRFSATKWTTVGLGARDLQLITPTDFEVIDTGAPITLTYDCVRTPY